MNNIMRVTIKNSRNNLLHDFSGSFFAEMPFFYDFVKKLASIAQLCNDVKVPLILVKLKDFYDIRVILDNFNVKIKYKFLIQAP